MGVADNRFVFKNVVERAGKSLAIEIAEVTTGRKSCFRNVGYLLQLTDLTDNVAAKVDIAQQFNGQGARLFRLFNKQLFALRKGNGLADVAKVGIKPSGYNRVCLPDVLSRMLEVRSYLKPKKIKCSVHIAYFPITFQLLSNWSMIGPVRSFLPQ